MQRRTWIVASILIVQVACALFFVSDIVLSVLGVPSAPIPWTYREIMEIAAAVGLVLGVALGAVVLRGTARRASRAEAALKAASGAFMELVDTRFEEWALTPAERDVALFALKGMSIAEIAGLRGTSQGTVKAQANAIYRKAGVTGRPQLLSLFVDDLIDTSAVPAARPDEVAAARQT